MPQLIPLKLFWGYPQPIDYADRQAPPVSTSDARSPLNVARKSLEDFRDAVGW